MAKKMSFAEWSNGASEAELKELEKTISKRFKVFGLISLIPFVNFITMGCAIFCYNNLSYLKSRGRTTGNDLFRGILVLYAFIIPPLIVVQACTCIRPLGNKVLGCKLS